MITLRPLNDSDYQAVSQWNFDSETSKYFLKRPEYNEESQQNWFNNQIGKKNKLKLIILDENGTRNGLVSLLHINDKPGSVELGITIGLKENLRKGIAFEALQKAIELAKSKFEIKIFYALIFEENKAAIGLFKKCGFTIKDDYSEIVLGPEGKARQIKMQMEV